MTDKEKTIKELKEALDSLDITNKYRLNLIRAIEYLQEEPVSEDICNQCEAHNDKDKCDELVFGHKCPITTESLDFDLDAASEEYITKVLERTNMLVGNGPVGEEINAAFRAGAQWQKTKDESTTEDLGDYINELSKQFSEVSFAKLSRIAVRVAKWQKENLWKPANGDDLPEYEREVVVFTQIFPDDAEMMIVAIGHRPNPEGWDGKSLSTGKVEHYTPKTYDKGGWNIPNVKYWLDCLMPKEIEL